MWNVHRATAAQLWLSVAVATAVDVQEAGAKDWGKKRRSVCCTEREVKGIGTSVSSLKSALSLAVSRVQLERRLMGRIPKTSDRQVDHP